MFVNHVEGKAVSVGVTQEIEIIFLSNGSSVNIAFRMLPDLK